MITTSMSWDITLLNVAMLCIYICNYIYIYKCIYIHTCHLLRGTAPAIHWSIVQVQAGDDLAKMLGEAALLADLGPLLRMKQVRVLPVGEAAVVGLLGIILIYNDNIYI